MIHAEQHIKFYEEQPYNFKHTESYKKRNLEILKDLEASFCKIGKYREFIDCLTKTRAQAAQLFKENPQGKLLFSTYINMTYTNLIGLDGARAVFRRLQHEKEK